MSRFPARRLAPVAVIAMMFALGVTPSVASAPLADHGSFTATGLPFANFAGALPSDASCGKEGVNSTTFKYSPPVDGVLDVRIDGFTGDWDLNLFDVTTGDELAYSGNEQSMGAAASEHLLWRVGRRQQVGILACNWLSPDHQIDVSYTLTAGDGFTTGAAAPSLSTLRNGGLSDLRETVPVNVVFLGYSPKQVSAAKFLAAMPRTYRPHVRIPSFYNVSQYLGITYTYQYNLKFTDRSYSNRFFSMMRSVGTVAGPTRFQKLYNEQAANVLDITSNLNVPAEKVEQWLGKNPPAGVDTLRNTIFFINWYGRKDFTSHVYRKLGEANTDTGIDFGTRDGQATIGWGGTPPTDAEDPSDKPYRVWFYDLSAGPEAWSENYIVDSKDLDGDGIEEYRMPPIWEYRTGAYREASALTSDLAKIARYVAINLMFTTSPLYSPAITPPSIPESVSLGLNWFEGRPNAGGNATASIPSAGAYDSVGLLTPAWYARTGEIQRKIQELLPLTKVSVEEQTSPLWQNAELSRCFAQFNAPTYGPGCYPGMPYNNFQNLYLYHAQHATDELKNTHHADYEVGIHTYFVPEDHLNYGFAYADSNQRDGTQSMVHWMPTPGELNTIGTTQIIIHETGHHFGMSHPHDGYDYEQRVDYSGYSGKWAFAAAGDEVNSVMGYMWLNNEFSQFDLDNHNRWMAAEYLSNSNVLIASILRSGHRDRTRAQLQSADALATLATTAFADHEYLTAHRYARDAYRNVLAAANAAGVPVKGSKAGLRVDAHANATLASLPRSPVGTYANMDRVTSIQDGIPIMRPLARKP